MSVSQLCFKRSFVIYLYCQLINSVMETKPFQHKNQIMNDKCQLKLPV